MSTPVEADKELDEILKGVVLPYDRQRPYHKKQGRQSHNWVVPELSINEAKIALLAWAKACGVAEK